MLEKIEKADLETTFELFLDQQIDANSQKEMDHKIELTVYPPEGWKFGFPKRLPQEWCELTALEKEKWFLDNEYPLDYVNKEYHLWSTIWETHSTT